MKGISWAIAGAILSFIGWMSPWLALDAFYANGDLLIRNRFSPHISLPAGNDPAQHVIMLLFCYILFLGAIAVANLTDKKHVIGLAVVSAFLIVLLEIFFLINSAVFSYAWKATFNFIWQWGIVAMFIGLALMLWGIFSMWLDSYVEQELTQVRERLHKLESATNKLLT